MMNFTGNVRDVQTLAHELGHGVHQHLSRKQGSLQGSTPLTTSETASVFGEMLVFEKLLQTETGPTQRLALLVSKIDDTIATVFRQVAMSRFEDRIHTVRRTEGELSVERFSRCWIESQEQMFQGSVSLGEHYRIWWSYIPHFVHTPGYVYAYAFGELLVLALYGVYQQDKTWFRDRYVQLLEAGGSDWPHVLLAELGVDLQNPAFWQEGLRAIEDLIVQAEEICD
jgi:oligoendopeptidase F